ncbi:hypothetical protein [Cohnella cholangitidis]|uniref:Uncharacterized protein n=1 Tax=Cohnella cholangitidis TaxID=2598458 RepID=A0A7G5C4G9_9BACL|nr:hypothetical protein [Cohnella cholangitidis]QMV44103.1 hypothetical protein FPL14_25235 [Cohnella cholangitidis]
MFVPTLSANAAETGSEPAADIESFEPTVLPKPPFQYYMSKFANAGPNAKKTAKLTLTQKSVKSFPFDQSYEDTAAFAAKEYTVPNSFRSIAGNLPEGTPIEYRGEMLVRAIKGKDRVFLIYGQNFGENRYLVAMDKTMTKTLYAYDFIHYAYSPKYVEADYDYIYQQIQWAYEEDGILYVSNSHRTYAKSSKGMNGYITAIRLADNKLLWRSASLVSNARSFEVVGDVIVSGYGFTAEKDYLYQLDKRTGKTLGKVALKDGPDYIGKQNNDIVVYGYSVVTRFKVK